jgi:predicted O-linked N-acetylglucosamine transferase (SPINDLY family)/Fe-S-cluster containining protein
MSERPPFHFPGDDPRSKRFTALAQYQEKLVEASLAGDRSGESLAAAVGKGQLLADADIEKLHGVVADAARQGKAALPACRAGCSHCCQRPPEATVAEVIAAVRFVESSFDATKREALNGRLGAYKEATTPFRPEKLEESREACPFLDGNLCSIYTVRPLSCRGFNSVDVSVCEEIAKGEKPAQARPILATQLGIVSAIRVGSRLGMLFEAIDPALLDLGIAAKIALDNPAAVDDALDGKDRFVEARMPYDLEPFEPGELCMAYEPSNRTEREMKPPTGNLPVEIVAQHSKFIEQLQGQGSLKGALAAFQGKHAANAMARIDVPRIAASDEEIHESRAAFVQAMRDFEASNFPASDAFDALSLHQTMNLTYQGLDSLEIMKEHARMVEGVASKCLPDLAAPIEGRPRKGKLRVGYISPNLNLSNGGRWSLGWVKNHGSEIETFCFLLGWRFDNVSHSLKEAADHFYWLTRSVPENARFIRSMDLDVLIFTDIGLHARSTQYSAFRMAPVQCTAWGHPDTTGLSTIDYYISSDMMEPPNGQDYYSEKLVRLPRTGICFSKAQNEPSIRDRAHFGIPEGECILLMAQANMKMLPKYDHLFAEICERANAPLTILTSSSAGDSIVLKARLNKAGVPTRWLSYQKTAEYLALMKLADVSIDPPLWSGGNSTLQSLEVGTPVVTLPGPFMRSRHSDAMLRIAGMEGLIAKDEKDFISLACDFDRQQDAMRGGDIQPLFEDKETVAALDDFLFQAGT